MVFEGALGRIVANLVKAEEFEEEALATELWVALLNGVSESDLESVTGVLPLVEEAVVWRVVAHRLERTLGQEGLIAVKGGRSQSGGIAMHPALEGYAKARERYRKVMKELFERLGGGKGAPSVNPRIDLVQARLGTWDVSVKQGTEAASPVAPVADADAIPIAHLFLRVGMSSIKNVDDATNGYIIDARTYL